VALFACGFAIKTSSNPRGKLVLAVSKGLAKEALDPISLDGSAHFP
jgi:hypothetical protein